MGCLKNRNILNIFLPCTNDWRTLFLVVFLMITFGPFSIVTLKNQANLLLLAAVREQSLFNEISLKISFNMSKLLSKLLSMSTLFDLSPDCDLGTAGMHQS